MNYQYIITTHAQFFHTRHVLRVLYNALPRGGRICLKGCQVKLKDTNNTHNSPSLLVSSSILSFCF